ncbi:MAG: hypothetical protein JWM25_1891 [Thermoleophilia bacterium]|nr:hypothetical protein [Thermoleophilia bacterium]MCZ4497306.1 hypothetical protein [Thermoleophilia bacterium]
MPATTTRPAHSGGGPAVLAEELRELATSADAAGRFAEGSYLIAGNREHELLSADLVAHGTLQRLQELLPEIVLHGGADDGLRIALRTATDLAGGRESLRGSTGYPSDLASGTAGSLFRNAAAGVRAIAEIAEFRSASSDAFHEAVRLLSLDA